ncbi:hypothetical protein MPSEU_000936500 [Mayamaea pseudoterrestris]|nr:hypothetical protein MPSEU_000936500 [Mayamaea pseudoterrestris]
MFRTFEREVDMREQSGLNGALRQARTFFSIRYRRFSVAQAILFLCSAFLTLQSTVHSADNVPVSLPNVYPNIDNALKSDKEKAKQKQKTFDSKRVKAPTSTRADVTAAAAAAASPSPQLVDALPVASTLTKTANNRAAGLYPISAAEKRMHRDFMDWCKQVLGIQTILEIQVFEYPDNMKALPTEDWGDADDDNVDIQAPPVESFPTIPVRGLAATRNIQEGETIIRIPMQALFSVATTIDNDPVLSRVMGPEARRKHGWDSGAAATANDDDASAATDSFVLEIPLLAIALLHHKKLGFGSPLSPYFRILERTPVDSFPFLWSNAKLRAETSEGIRAVARGIKRDVRDMYTTVVQVLIDEHPDIFGNRTSIVDEAPLDDAGAEELPIADEWMFSLEHFQWAFAIVNSRHWQLPIPDLTAGHLLQHPNPRRDSVAVEGGDDPLLPPPADMPTDHWVQGAATPNEATNRTLLHSFMAPVADMLNFGPPCTRGRYDEATHTFEIIASCSFLKGQEVTFWYANECDHVMVGVYGFTHPLVPKCPSAEEYHRMSEEWQRQAKELYDEVDQKNQLVAQLDAEVAFYQDVLERCSCCKYDREDAKENDKDASGSDNGQDHPTTLLRHEHVRGAIHNGEEHGRRRVRKKQVDEDDEGDEF